MKQYVLRMDKTGSFTLSREWQGVEVKLASFFRHGREALDWGAEEFYFRADSEPYALKRCFAMVGRMMANGTLDIGAAA